MTMYQIISSQGADFGVFEVAMSAAADAIAHSISHTEIVHLDHDPSAIAELTRVCETHTRGNEEHEFCGTDADGDEWRVHVALAGQVAS